MIDKNHTDSLSLLFFQAQPITPLLSEKPLHSNSVLILKTNVKFFS